MIRALLVSLGYGVVMLTAEAVSAADAPTTEYCDKEWEELSSQYALKSPPDYDGLLQAWKAIDKKCGESALYKARLSLTYFFLDRQNEARQIIGSISPADRQREPMAQLMELILDVAALQTEADSRAIEPRLRSFVERNPTFVVGFSLLADVLGESGKDEKAIELYERVLSATGPSRRSVGVLRNLTISYANVTRYQDAYDAAEKAVTIDKSLLDDLYFVCAAAKAHATVGEIKVARDLLTLMATKYPQVENDQDFKAAVAFVIEKTKARTR